MMATREEIREGIGKLLSPFFLAMDEAQDRQDEELLTNSMMRVEFCKVIEAHLTIILQYLHSQGVVIKVDRELPMAFYPQDSIEGFTEEAVKQDMLKWHNDSLMPLVEK